VTSVRETFISRTAMSKEQHARLVASLPGGETRSVAGYPPYPVVLISGAGSTVRDLDGNEYLDLLNNYTSLVHGHSHPRISEAVREALPSGTVFPAPHPAQGLLAEQLVSRLPAVELVRFTNSGSEAAVLAGRLARHVTGRKRMVLFAGGYHGTGERFADPSDEVIRLPYNDTAALRHAVDDSIGAIFVEPFLGSGGVVVAQEDFLQAVQESARKAGALFVLDEIQGLRNHYHGTHAALGLSPDLVLMGKIIGGGLPVGAIGGRRDLLDSLSSSAPRQLPHSGTFNGNVLSMVAGATSMELLTAQAIARMDRMAAALQADITRAGKLAGLDVTVTRSGSILHVHFLSAAPVNHEEAERADLSASALLHLALLNHGVYTAPRGMLNLSTVLGDDAPALAAEAYAQAFAEVAREWDQGGPAR
jgi:glutamate-1-semialdehyde 2,1-aminomutase